MKRHVAQASLVLATGLIATALIANVEQLSAARAQNPQNGSQVLSAGAVSLLASPVLSLTGKPVEASMAFGVGGAFIVAGVVQSGVDLVKITLQNVGNSTQYVVEASARSVERASVMAGQTLQVTQQASGYTLLASGVALAFIPNALGQSLLHQSPVR